MLATVAPAPPSEPGYIIEPKYDGWRALAYKGDGPVRMETRTGGAITSVLYLADALELGLPANTVLDGEIVDLSGGAQWNRTQSILSRKAMHQPSDADPALAYVLFDVLELEGSPLMGEPLSARRKLLKLIVSLIDSPDVLLVPELAADDPDADAYFNKLVEDGYEGVVCKRLDSTYALGARNGAWLKVKPEAEMDVEVTGTYEPEPGSKYDGNSVGGITFKATHDDGTVYEGRCAGMDNNLREQLWQAPENFVGKVAEVAYAKIGDAGALRFPRFKRFRAEEDKSVAELVDDAVQEVVPSNSTSRILLKRALEAEERVDELEEENADLKVRLGGAVKAAVKPRRSGGSRSAGKTRNYNAMENGKLESALQDLERGTGDAHSRALATEANGGWSVKRHLAEATVVAESRGMR